MTIEKRLNSKELALRAIDDLPDDAGLDEILDEIKVFHAIRDRIEHADTQQAIAHDDVKQRMADWPR